MDNVDTGFLRVYSGKRFYLSPHPHFLAEDANIGCVTNNHKMYIFLSFGHLSLCNYRLLCQEGDWMDDFTDSMLRICAVAEPLLTLDVLMVFDMTFLAVLPCT